MSTVISLPRSQVPSKLSFLLSQLRDNKGHHMCNVTITVSGEDRFLPQLVQFCTITSGRFLFHHLEEDSHEGLFEAYISEEQLISDIVLNKALSLINGASGMDMDKDGDLLYNYKII